MKRLLTMVSLLAFAAAAFLGGYLYDRWHQAQRGSSRQEPRKIAYYQDPMHPWYKSDKPGIAPDCGMKLVPIYADGSVGHSAAPATGSERRDGTSAQPPGTIQLSADRQQLMGVRYTQVEISPGATSIRAVGKVAEDETRITRVHSKVDGWIDKVTVGFTGDFVRQGQTLLTVYSPELLSVQQEYLLSLKARDVMSHSSMAELSSTSGSLVHATRRRLELLDMSSSQIADLEHTGAAVKTVAVFSPTTGYVLARNAFASQRITPETELYQIADLSHVWVLADVFETDAPNVRIGQVAHINAPGDPSIDVMARVSYIQPEIDPATRTWKVRLDVPNRRMKLKPQMYLELTFDIKTPPVLQIPAEAVINAGPSSTVFVDRGNGFFEPRTVQTGQRLGDRIQILGGLQAGERIVSSGAFLLDSESQLRSGSPRAGDSEKSEGSPMPGMAEHQHGIKQ